MIVHINGHWHEAKLKFRGQLGQWERSIMKAVFEIQGKWGSLFTGEGFASRHEIAKHLGQDPQDGALLKRISRTLSYLAGERGRDRRWIVVRRIAKKGLKNGANRILILKRAIKLRRWVSPLTSQGSRGFDTYITSGTSVPSGHDVARNPGSMRVLSEGLAAIIGGERPPMPVSAGPGGSS